LQKKKENDKRLREQKEEQEEKERIRRIQDEQKQQSIVFVNLLKKISETSSGTEKAATVKLAKTMIVVMVERLEMLKQRGVYIQSSLNDLKKLYTQVENLKAKKKFK
jgi:hypothetical protein